MQHEREVPPLQPLLTIKQVQKALGLSRSMVYLLIQRGEIRAIHIGTAIRVRPSEIRRFIQEHEAAEQAGQRRYTRRKTKQREQGAKPRHGPPQLRR